MGAICPPPPPIHLKPQQNYTVALIFHCHHCSFHIYKWSAEYKMKIVNKCAWSSLVLLKASIKR